MKHVLLAIVACALALTIACSSQQMVPTATLPPTPIPTDTPAPEITGIVTLPSDEGVHLTPVEWWYFNGHLEDADGREYSFHFVTFLTVTPDGQVPQLIQLGWADHQEDVYLDSEKAALVNEQERTTNRFRFQVEGWGMTGDGTDYRLDFNIGGYMLELTAISQKTGRTASGSRAGRLGDCWDDLLLLAPASSDQWNHGTEWRSRAGFRVGLDGPPVG